MTFRFIGQRIGQSVVNNARLFCFACENICYCVSQKDNNYKCYFISGHWKTKTQPTNLLDIILRNRYNFNYLLKIYQICFVKAPLFVQRKKNSTVFGNNWVSAWILFTVAHAGGNSIAFHLCDKINLFLMNLRATNPIKVENIKAIKSDRMSLACSLALGKNHSMSNVHANERI